jgi:hypothetical protein
LALLIAFLEINVKMKTKKEKRTKYRGKMVKGQTGSDISNGIVISVCQFLLKVYRT